MLNGTSSSGKTTLAQGLQERFARAGECWFVIGVDDMFALLPGPWVTYGTHVGAHAAEGISFELVDGTVERRVGPIGHQVLRPTAAGRAASRAGLNVIVDEVLLDEKDWLGWQEVLEGLDVLWVQVTCDLAVVEARERGRADRMLGLARSQRHRPPLPGLRRARRHRRSAPRRSGTRCSAPSQLEGEHVAGVARVRETGCAWNPPRRRRPSPPPLDPLVLDGPTHDVGQLGVGVLVGVTLVAGRRFDQDEHVAVPGPEHPWPGRSSVAAPRHPLGIGSVDVSHPSSACCMCSSSGCARHPACSTTGVRWLHPTV